MNDESHLPPHSIEAEQACLGGLCLDPSYLDEVEGIIAHPDAFYRVAHRHLYAAMIDLYRKDGEFDWNSLVDHITATGQIDACGGRDELFRYLRSITDMPSGYGTPRNATIVMANYVKRRAIAEGHALAEFASQPTNSTDETLTRAWQAYAEVSKARGVRDRSTDIIEAAEEAIRDSQEGRLRGYYAGYGHLNGILGGLAWGGLYIVGARPGKGKTGFLLNLAQKYLLSPEDGMACGLWTSEMPAKQIAARMLCCLSGVDGIKFRRGNLNNEDRAEIEAARDDYKGGQQFRVDDRPGRNVYDLCNIFRGWHKKYGTRIFFVDYIQNMGRIPGIRDNYEKIAETSNSLKQFALANNSIIIAAAQLNRKAEEGKRRPIMSDLEGAGALEQDADGIVMLHKLATGKFDDPTANYEMNVVKNRHGPTGRALFVFHKAVTRFDETARHD